jgi:hypothetical protein
VDVASTVVVSMLLVSRTADVAGDVLVAAKIEVLEET